MSHRHRFATPREFLNHEYNIIGYYDHILYVVTKPTVGNGDITIWSVHTMIPKSWNKLHTISINSFAEVLLSALTTNGDAIYVLILYYDQTSFQPCCEIIKCFNECKDMLVYSLDQSEQNRDEFEKVEVSDVGIVCGETDAFLVDRNVTRGALKYTKLICDDSTQTFRVQHIMIPGDDRGLRFPIHFNPDKKQVLRYTEGENFIMFNEDTNQWDTYTPSIKCEVDVAQYHGYGISVTYGTARAKCMAISSSFSMFGRDGMCFACVYDTSRRIDTFYKFTLDEAENTYTFTRVGSFYRPKTVFQYRLATNGIYIVRLGKKFAEFLRTETPSLREIAFWGVQAIFGNKDHEENWIGGKTEDEIRKGCNIRSAMTLV